METWERNILIAQHRSHVHSMEKGGVGLVSLYHMPKPNSYGMGDSSFPSERMMGQWTFVHESVTRLMFKVSQVKEEKK